MLYTSLMQHAQPNALQLQLPPPSCPHYFIHLFSNSAVALFESILCHLQKCQPYNENLKEQHLLKSTSSFLSIASASFLKMLMGPDFLHITHQVWSNRVKSYCH